MKLNKKKIFTLALAVCLIATLSMGSLAWFTDDDSVTNNFLVAGSDDENPDDIFSVDVWEDNSPEDLAGENKIQDGVKYESILPGDALYKEVNVENTGAYDQYIRVTVTVSDAALWKEIFATDEIVPLEELTDFETSSAYYTTAYYDGVNDTFIYYLYYNNVLEPDEVMNVFTQVFIPEQMDRDQAARLTADGFYINIVADAVQTKNVGKNVLEAFYTVGLLEEIPDNTVYTSVYTLQDLLDTLAAGANPKLMADIEVTENDMTAYNASVKTGITVVNDAVINLNGFDLTFAKVDGNRVMALCVENCDVKIKGQGVVSASNENYDTLIWSKDGATVTIESGEYAADVIFYGSKSTGDVGKIVVNGGNFICGSDDAANVANHGNGKITYYGGTFNWDPTVEDADDAAFIKVADGYVAEMVSNGTYAVLPVVAP